VHRFSYRGMGLGTALFVNEFIQVGLTDKSDIQTPLFLLFLAMYMVTALGNLGLIILIVMNSHL
jgi:olfactory receptor